ncbi:MAG: hypothetical protein PHU69_07630 [Fermentimonas sp.]|nr:hypothetical protein [Fermentimonas sp.]
MMRKVRENVIYSEEFRKVVLQAYPDEPKIKELLDANAYFLGRYLDDGCCGSGMVSVSAEEIITARGLGQQAEFCEALFERANKEKLRSLAYKMWGKQWFED